LELEVLVGFLDLLGEHVSLQIMLLSCLELGRLEVLALEHSGSFSAALLHLSKEVSWEDLALSCRDLFDLLQTSQRFQLSHALFHH